MEGIVLLFLVFVAPFLIYIGIMALATKAAKPVIRYSRDRQIERDLRDEVADMEATQRAAQKLLAERNR